MLARDKFTSVSVPSDGSCLYWATSLAYLFPVRHTATLFTDRFVQAFGHEASSKSSLLRDLLLAWTPHRRTTSFTNIVAFMQPLVSIHFRQRIIQEMFLRRDQYQHFISLNSFCESQNEGFFTRGLFQEHFVSKFGPEIEECGVDITNFRPKCLGLSQMAALDAELDKMASQEELTSFKYDMYLKCMSLSTSWGGQHEIQAVSQVLKCNIHVFHDKDKMADVTFTGGAHWIHLVHTNCNHYNFGLVKASNMLDEMKIETNFEEIERCFSLGVDDVNESNRLGWTMLHFAACRGDERLVRLLVEHGADVRVENKHRKTPADLVQKYRMFGVMQLLEKELLRIEQDEGIEPRTQLTRNAKCNDNIPQDILVSQDKSTKAMQTTSFESMWHFKDHDNMSSEAAQTMYEGLKTAHSQSSKPPEHKKLKTASKGTQTTGEPTPLMSSLRQVEVLQQHLLQVIEENNILERTVLASKRLEENKHKELITETGFEKRRSFDSLKKEIDALKEENAVLKITLEHLELTLRSTQNIVDPNSALTKNTTGNSGEVLTKCPAFKKRTIASPKVRLKKHVPMGDQTCDVKFPSLLSMRGINNTMASNMEAAGGYPNVPFRHILPQHGDWSTDVLKIIHKDKDKDKHFEAYDFLNTYSIKEEELKF